MVSHHIVQGIQRFILGHGHHDPFAGSQSVGLNHDGSAFFFHKGTGIRQVVTDFEEGSGHPILLHQFLGEDLGAFDFRCFGTGSEDGQSPGFEHIHDACHQGSFRPHHGQVDIMLFRPVCQAIQIRNIQVHTFCQVFHARVPWSCIDFRHTLALGQLPDQGMLPAAAPDYQYLHAMASLILRFPAVSSDRLQWPYRIPPYGQRLPEPAFSGFSGRCRPFPSACGSDLHTGPDW